MKMHSTLCDQNYYFEIFKASFERFLNIIGKGAEEHIAPGRTWNFGGATCL